MPQTFESFFEPGGPIAQELPGFSPRPQQLQAAAAISAAMGETGTVALVEAGTGVGKTLAYLVPAILRARPERKIIISTHTLALQAQLWSRDIPLAVRLQNKKLRTALLKGRGNYLCLQELHAAQADLTFMSDRKFEEILDWSEDTETGDLAELSFNYPEWSEIAAHPDTCRGADCRYYENCFFYKAKRTAEDASIILVNHALYFSDLAMRLVDQSMSLLPDYTMVVFDEAHHLEATASQAFGVTITSSRVASVIKRLRRGGSTIDVDENRLRLLERESSELFSEFANCGKSEFIVSEIMPDLSWVRGKSETIAEIIQQIIVDLSKVDTTFDQIKKERVEGLQRQTVRLREEILSIFHRDDKDHMRWGSSAKFRDRSTFVSLHWTPIDVGERIDEALWQRNEVSAALISATLATNGNFDFFKKRLGLSPQSKTVRQLNAAAIPRRAIKTVEVLADSPFNYVKNCLLYIPRHLPAPNDSLDYVIQVVSEITKLVYSSNGGAFLLFTSHRMLNHAYSHLSESGMPYPLFRQGEMPSGRLIDEFRKSRNGVLFGTQSFWEGVDVPGDSLRMVVVDRIPFGSPDSPMHKARVNAITADGGDWFKEFALPQAQLKLKQGFGRLIRTTTDRGVVAILDSRLLTKNYGADFLKYLPPAQRTLYIDEVQEFYAAGSVDNPNGSYD